MCGSFSTCVCESLSKCMCGILSTSTSERLSTCVYEAVCLVVCVDVCLTTFIGVFYVMYLMHAWRTRVCHHYINRHLRATVGSHQANRKKDVESHVKLRREEMDQQDNSPSKRNVSVALNLKSKDDSAIHSLSLLDRSTYSPTNRETAQNDRKQAKSHNHKVLFKTAIKKDQQGGGEQHIFATTLSKEAREKDETRLKMRCQCKDLSNSQGNQDTAILDQHTEDSSNTVNTREQKM